MDLNPTICLVLGTQGTEIKLRSLYRSVGNRHQPGITRLWSNSGSILIYIQPVVNLGVPAEHSHVALGSHIK